MSNLSVKGHEREMVPAVEAISPFRAMRRLLGWDPFREMAPFIPAEEPGLTFTPAFEIKETKDAYEFRADIPGVEETDVEITVTGNRLTVSGTREAEREEKSDRFFATERLYGSFVRSFTLPEDIDPQNVRASLANGVLTISVPKKPETQPRKISVAPRAAQPQEGGGEPQRAAEAQKATQPSGPPQGAEQKKSAQEASAQAKPAGESK